MPIHPLNGSWQLRCLSAAVPARFRRWTSALVPGTVHGALLKAGKIPDPYVGRNELDLQWIDQHDWEFRKQINLVKSDLRRPRQELIFDGLDTVAQIFVNGKRAGSSVNMFRQVILDVRGKLQAGRNEISVVFSSPTGYAARQAKVGKGRVSATDFKWQTGESRMTHRAWIRKTQCHFGWDWGVHLATSGIWQSARLALSDGPRIDSVTVEQQHANRQVQLRITVLLTAAMKVTGSLKFSIDEQQIAEPAELKKGLNTLRMRVVIKNPRLWWPAGQGEQNLYLLRVAWSNADGFSDQEICRNIGLRTLELVRDRDKAIDGQRGESFYFKINGRPVFAKGANWIPPDQFVERCTPEVYRHLLQSMVEANQNMVRVWGGGWYEQTIFYDLCDELGLMVWQDFMMACALYPDSPAFVEQLTAEAHYQVRRLHTHPSIVLWCGDNEDAEAVWGWWGSSPDFKQNVTIYQHTLSALREACLAEDRTRPFWISSPSNNEFQGHNNDPNRGDVHYWTVWHGKQPFSNYLTMKPRFASEFGFQSFPEARTLRPVVGAEELNPSSREMEHHQRSADGNLLITNTMAREMRIAKDFDTFCWVSQINQAMAIRTAVEHWRRLKPWCMGTLYWQLNDLWPAASWSSIDYHGRWKVLHHFAQRFYAPLLASFAREGEVIEAWLTSDLHGTVNFKGQLEVFRWDGSRVNRLSIAGTLRPLHSRAVARWNISDLLKKAEPHEICMFLRIDGGDVSSDNFTTLVPWKWVNVVPPELETELIERDGILELSVRGPRVVPFFHAELDGQEGHFTGDWQLLRPNVLYKLRWQPHRLHGAVHLKLHQARKLLRTMSLYDTFAHH